MADAYPIRPVVHADGVYADMIDAVIRAAQKLLSKKQREIGRLNIILARAFYREAWHGGFW